MNDRRLVILESPYAGDVDANVFYARRCLRDSLRLSPGMRYGIAAAEEAGIPIEHRSIGLTG
jgi:hypothetical protein